MDKALKEVLKSLMKKFDEYMTHGSSWILHELLRLDLQILEYISLRGSTYTPPRNDLEAKHAVGNIKNKDQKCFIWSIALTFYGDPNIFG